MSLDNENEVVQEQQTPEQPEQAQEQQPEVVEQAPKESSEERSLRILRERAAKAERERDELLHRMQQSQQPTQEEEDLSINVNPDDLLEGKHATKLIKKISQLEKKLQSYERQSKTSTAEVKLRVEMPDFDSVVSAENIATLRETYPEVAASIGSNPDLYAQAKSAYTIIKKLGIAPSEDIYQDKLKASKNLAKPTPSASIARTSSTPLTQINMFENGLTEDVKKRLYNEMMAAINS